MISLSQRNLLEAIKASLFNVEPNYVSDVDWPQLVAEAKAQTVMGLISPVIPVMDETSVQIKALYMRIMYEQDLLIKCFEKEHIPCVILKGSAASVYYPKPYLRTMGDIDILVPQIFFKKSLELLELKGYSCAHEISQEELNSNKIREIEYDKNGIIFEIHKRFSSPGFDVDEILESAIHRRAFNELNGYRFPTLPSPENGLVLLGHINKHLRINQLGLRQIIDWEMYVYSMADNPLWRAEFLPLVEKTGLLKLAAYVTKLCNRHLGLPCEVGFGIETDNSLVDELLDVVLTDGNFGRKVYDDMTVEEKKMLGVSKGIKRLGFFGYFTQVGLGTSNFFAKHPSFKIGAFCYGIVRQVCRGGKSLVINNNASKKIGGVKKVHDLHSKRQSLYKMLGVKMENE